MSTTDDDAASRLGWGLRRYWWVVVAAIVATTFLAVTGPARSLLSPDQRFEASALVVATQLQIKPEQLPRAAQAVFNGGTVAERVAREAGVPVNADVLIPDRVRLEALNDTIALRVIGVDADPEVAAELANLTAVAFVDELNEIGEGVGIFKVQDAARPPAERPGRPSPIVPLGIGVIGGVALGSGVVILVLLWRRPVLGLTDARHLAGTTRGAVVSMPRQSATLLPETIPGISLVARQLWPDDRGVGAVVGVGRNFELRNQVVRVLAMAQSRRSPVHVIASRRERVDALALGLSSAPRVTVLQDWILERLGSVGPHPDMGTDSAVLVSVSAADFDVPQLIPRSGRATLFVPQGTPARALEAAAQQFPADLLVGIILVKRTRGNRDKSGDASGRAAAPQDGRHAAPEADSPADVHGREGAGQVAAGRSLNGGGGAQGGNGQHRDVRQGRDESALRPAERERQARD